MIADKYTIKINGRRYNRDQYEKWAWKCPRCGRPCPPSKSTMRFKLPDLHTKFCTHRCGAAYSARKIKAVGTSRRRASAINHLSNERRMHEFLGSDLYKLRRLEVRADMLERLGYLQEREKTLREIECMRRNNE